MIAGTGFNNSKHYTQFVGHKAHTLSSLLIPLKIHWSALFSPRFGLDEEFLDLENIRGQSLNYHFTPFPLIPCFPLP